MFFLFWCLTYLIFSRTCTLDEIWKHRWNSSTFPQHFQQVTAVLMSDSHILMRCWNGELSATKSDGNLIISPNLYFFLFPYFTSYRLLSLHSDKKGLMFNVLINNIIYFLWRWYSSWLFFSLMSDICLVTFSNSHGQFWTKEASQMRSEIFSSFFLTLQLILL